jgi:hypothetical protein
MEKFKSQDVLVEQIISAQVKKWQLDKKRNIKNPSVPSLPFQDYREAVPIRWQSNCRKI